ncbi:LexA repressor [compost metagenome]
MTDTRTSLKQLATEIDLRDVSIRELGRRLAIDGKDVHPETIKFHWKKLFEAGEVSYLYDGRTLDRRSSSVNDDSLPDDAKLVTIPVFGVADCGPATQVADQQDLGTLRISSRLLETKNYDNLYSVQASGESMNNTSVHGHPIHNGDYVIVDRSRNTPRNGDCVVAIVDGLANIKKFYREQGRITLVSESTEQYDPIFIHPEDQSDSLIGGTVIQVVPKPKHF